MSDSDSRKGGIGTIVAVGGMCAALIANYLQFQKNKSDDQSMQRQISVAQQQANIASEELSLKKQELNMQLGVQNRATQDCRRLLAERDDALNAVHMYDNAITKHQLNLESERQQLAMAESQHDSDHVAEHKSLAELEENGIKSLTDSRNEAAARVRDIEQSCK